MTTSFVPGHPQVEDETLLDLFIHCRAEEQRGVQKIEICRECFVPYYTTRCRHSARNFSEMGLMDWLHLVAAYLEDGIWGR